MGSPPKQRIADRRTRGRRLIVDALAATALVAATPASAQDGGGSGLTLQASDQEIRLGEDVTLRGTRQPANADKVVELRYKRVGGDRYEVVDQTRTDSEGRFSFREEPRFNGRYRAYSQSGDETLESDYEVVEVHARLSIGARAHQLRSRDVVVTGRLYPSISERRVHLERLTGKGWDRVEGASTRGDGEYRIDWRPPNLGSYELRTVFRGDDRNLSDRATLSHRVYVYRSDESSYYGPGLYGNRTACGQTLREDTVGVAHKRIPCGTRVRFYYRGESERIRVIDRGPYVGDRRWDLTEGARRKLDFPRGVDQIWADR